MTRDEVEIESLTGAQIVPMINELARLRIEVFAEWPYLYEGDAAYESDYLRAFARAPHALLVIARAEGMVVGAATASPMHAQEQAIRAPLESAGHDLARMFYFGESVLLEQWRGRGVGHAFFDHREAHARDRDASCAVFAAVEREADHPARRRGHRALDPFWRARGYAPLQRLETSLSWKDRGESAETPKPMRYWMRAL